jgi:hypothetical protein
VFLMWLALGVVALPALILCLPVRIRLTGRIGSPDEADFSAAVGLVAGALGACVSRQNGCTQAMPTLFGMGLWRFSLAGGKKKHSPGSTSDGKDASAKEDGPGTKPGWRQRALRFRVEWVRVRNIARRLRRPLVRFVKRMARSIRIRRVAGRLVFGLEDPAATGRAYGYGMAVGALLGPRFELRLQPEFSRSTIAGDLDLWFSVYLIVVVWALLALGIRGAFVWLRESRAHKRGIREIERAEAATPASV